MDCVPLCESAMYEKRFQLDTNLFYTVTCEDVHTASFGQLICHLQVCCISHCHNRQSVYRFGFVD